MKQPLRLQRTRKKGTGYLWPRKGNVIFSNNLSIVYVGRPTKWGNPFKTGKNRLLWYKDRIRNIHDVIKRVLKGKNLACWCPLDQPCHADILLRIANS
ncbi:MAG: DUF4326 domain-containing protein [Candidatus Omnitrophica bacterium]|nr:DUF4326 domain-containing protein [Candidatus Omnitrophota bacterium]